MSFVDIFKKSVLEGFSGEDLSATKIITTLCICLLISVYIFFVYRFVTRKTFYDKNFSISMAIISVVVAGILLAMQSSLVISLGMVGALSIVRFRTAIKDPFDLLFLFWSIGTGIMCGAGLYKLSILSAGAVTVGMLLLWLIPITSSPHLIIVNARNKEAEPAILRVIGQYATKYQIDSKNIRADGMDMIVQVRSKQGGKLVDALSELEDVTAASLLVHEGEVKC